MGKVGPMLSSRPQKMKIKPCLAGLGLNTDDGDAYTPLCQTCNSCGKGS
jgi:hypothetical protein